MSVIIFAEHKADSTRRWRIKIKIEGSTYILIGRGDSTNEGMRVLDDLKTPYEFISIKPVRH